MFIIIAIVNASVIVEKVSRRNNVRRVSGEKEFSNPEENTRKEDQPSQEKSR